MLPTLAVCSTLSSVSLCAHAQTAETSATTAQTAETRAPTANATPASTKVTPPSEPPRKHRLNWHFPRFRWWEYAAASAVSVGNISLELAYQGGQTYSWNSTLPGDKPARSWLQGGTTESQTTAARISDHLWHGSTYYVLLDGLITPLATDKLNADVAFQLTLLNWQAIGTAGLIARLTHIAVRRTRPSLQGCSNEEGAVNHCEFRGASFVAGHAMMTSANAGLACAHHYSLPLYGGGAGDAVVCPVMVTAALSVGVLRIIADKHWLSDTLVGWALGGSIGYGLPYLLHYRPVHQIVSPLPNTALLPFATSDTVGLQFAGLL